MMRWTSWFLAVVSTTALTDAQGVIEAPPQSASEPFGPVLYAATTTIQGDVGALLDVRGGPPWTVDVLAKTSGEEWLRAFGPHVFAVGVFGSTITMVARDGREEPVVFDFGRNSQPQDICVVGAKTAFVALRNDPVLRRVDLSTGVATPAVDLSVLAAPGEEIGLRTMTRHRNRLFVQMGFFMPQNGASRGALAVVDLASEALVDVDPVAGGIQAIELDGAPPHARMQVLEESNTLYVSTTEGYADNRGGIEMVDLVTLESIGFALTEDEFGADLGGFVMTSPHGGYFLFHTDIVASTHLKPFTVAGGVEPGPEMIVLLGEALDSLAYDPLEGRIYLPTGFAFFPPAGIYAFDTRTNQPVEGAIETGPNPRDILLGF